MDMETLQQEEDALRKEISQLPPEAKKHYYELEKQCVKDPDTYAVLNWFFAAGLHHFYLGNTGRGAINAVIMLIGLLMIQTFGIFLILLVIIIELPQLFKSQSIVYQYNNNVMRRLLAEVKNEVEEAKHHDY
ncbi:TM2 domain-containing protein [Paraneptunicella aestuarii]|uniref:TM2 domain-containing protein n=1 Tax=Paraneptunicella aestuarii TaxID=2831148 RepID=UPI001E38B77A|nr:TM2 domain-containing protein [Paraneptunicella aestuarii]UAA37650.1 TM2 domain-containing protein [Paraneptunicella aestuarii]